MLNNLPARIQAMHNLHGRVDGMVCKYCKRLVQAREHGRNCYKCKLSKIIAGEDTDWLEIWPACGKYQDKEQI